MSQIIDATRIDQFFQSASRDAQGLLPHLVRYLVAATTDADQLLIPAGDSIGRPGYDGLARVAQGNRHVPQGQSVWEMGTGDPAEKAEGDYAKRTTNPGGIKPAETTFVFVTPHRWDGKEKWVTQKKQERRWRDVRCLDNVDLETWLEGAPGVARWLARQIMPEAVGGLRDLELFWGEQRVGGSTQPTAELIIGGRKEAADQLTQWLTHDDREIVVQGEDAAEAAAFVAAVVMSLPEDQRERTILRTLFVDQRDAVDYLCTLLSPHIVIALTPEVYRRAQALGVPRLRIIFAKARSAGSDPQSRVNLRLGSVGRAAVAAALLQMGVPEQRASRIAVECKGSLTAVLWMLAGEPDTPLPWAGGAAAAELLPLVLAGQWAADNARDCGAIAKLAGRDYREVESTLREWETPRGPTIRRGNVWDWTAWDFAWGCLAERIDHQMVERFRDIAVEVLGQPDPQFGLPADERWTASLHGQVHPFSNHLRSGLVASIVQFSLHDSRIQGGSGGALAGGLVRGLLAGPASQRKAAWLSLAPWLPDLAEASPDQFLQAVDGMARDPNTVAALFEEAGPFPSSMHVHVLWALERLAWSAAWFPRAVVALADLAVVDPGGQLSNRPLDSLMRIFLPWLPQTAATVAERLDAFGLIHGRSADVAWKLAVSLMPESHGMTHPTAEPQWHDWKPTGDARPATREFWDFAEPMIDRTMGWTGQSAERWAVLVHSYNDVRLAHPALGERLLNALEHLDPGQWPDTERRILAEAIRDLLRRHRDFPDQDWSMGPALLAQFEQLCDRIQPRDHVERHAWLFVPWPELPTGRTTNYQEHDHQVAEARLNALREVHAARGMDGVYALGQVAESPGAVGITLAQLDLAGDAELELVNHTLTLEPGPTGPPLLLLGMGYIAGIQDRRGMEAVFRLAEPGWTSNAYANLALALRRTGPVWDRLDAWGADAARLYWSRVMIHLLDDPSRDAQRATTRLLEAGRHYTAVYLCAGSLHRARPGIPAPVFPVPTELVVRCLEETPTHDPKIEPNAPALGSFGHHVSELLDLLEATGTDLSVLARIEWAWMVALEHTPRGLKSLQVALSRNPRLFVDALELVFRAEGEAPGSLPQSDENRAMQAYRLLGAWHRVPGTVGLLPEKGGFPGDVPFAEGEVDRTGLSTWFAEARDLAQTSGRIRRFYLTIGEVLAYAPLAPDGNWPCQPVRELIESERSDELERGIGAGLYNKRGGHMRQRGGDQERKVRDKFRRFANAVGSGWPRTQAMLLRIADTYNAEARREDERAAFEEFES